LLDRSTLGRGYFDKARLEKFVEANEGGAGHYKEIFSLATLELWHRAFAGSGPAPLN
jgi:hypothetical protein